MTSRRARRLPAYEIKKIDNAKIAFIGLTLEATPRSSRPPGVAGLEFRPEVQTTNALVQKLRNEQGVRAFVVLLHQGGFQNPPAPGPFRGRRTRTHTPTSTAASASAAPRSRQSPTGSTRRST